MEDLAHAVARLEERVTALDRLLQAELKTRDGHITLARQEIERRLEGMNEIREQITAERGQYAKWETVNAVSDRVTSIEAAQKGSENLMRWALGVMMALFAAASVAVSVWRR